MVEKRVVPPQLSVEVLKTLVEQTNNRTVSFVGTTSASDAVVVKVTVAPGRAGESSVNAVKVGRLFTLKGEAVDPDPCVATALHRGLVATASHTHANQSFDSANGATSVVVVAAVEVAPLAVNAETAQRVAPAPHVGTAAELAVGALPLLQMSR